jgi:RNA polymerase sigma-70 factor (ECF subfamily)
MNYSTEEVWSEFNRQLKMFIRQHVNDEAIADDILQEVFVRIHANIDNLNDQSKIRSWIYQITRNLIVDHFRLHKSVSLPDQAFPDHEEETSGDFMQKAIEDMIGMMNEMPPEYCEALCLTEIAGLNQKAYADKIGISYSGAKSRIQRGRKMLKDMLMNCCHYQFDVYGSVIGIRPRRCCCCNNPDHKH